MILMSNLSLQILLNLEGIRYVLDVTARLCVASHAPFTECVQKANHLCSLWESILFQASKNENKPVLCDVSFLSEWFFLVCWFIDLLHFLRLFQ